MAQALTIVAQLWDANLQSLPWSRCYDETWVEKLYRGCRRNLTSPFRFQCFTERPREFFEPIETVLYRTSPATGYGCLLEPYERVQTPMIIMGLDTIVTGNLDELAAHALRTSRFGVPRDPYFTDTICNGIIIAPPGHPARLGAAWDKAMEYVYVREGWLNDDVNTANSERFRDMDTMRGLYAAGHVDVLDDLFPGQVISYKGRAKADGLGDARIVYFHGPEKPHEIAYAAPWIAEHWI